MADDLSRAPWDEAAVAVLNRWQRAPIHPFVCLAGRHDHPNGPRPALIAHADGFHCPDEGCDYRQDWAFASMTVPPPPEWLGSPRH